MKFALAIAILTAALVSHGAVAQTFHGYLCTDDCSGHEAGYQWAEKEGIVTVEDCTGNSESFIEGCTAYVEENASIEIEREMTRDE